MFTPDDKDDPEVYVTGTGVVLRDLHDRSACEGRGCVIHHPSNHALVTWKTHWRSDTRVMERLCVHGVGHPDPDDCAYYASIGDETRAKGIHGCDGCCTATQAPSCGCYKCNPTQHRMFLCSTCGNKRCPKAANHENACTNSNAPGQVGSLYAGRPEIGSVWKHKVRAGAVHVKLYAVLQLDGPNDNAEAVVYTHDGEYYVRTVAEFMDGRFTPWP